MAEIQCSKIVGTSPVVAETVTFYSGLPQIYTVHCTVLYDIFSTINL